jgi:uncharacterized protein
VRSGWILLAYIVAVFLGGALLAPVLYWLAGALVEHFPSLHFLSGHPFHRFVNRGILIVALLGLWPLARRLGMNSWSAVGLAGFRQEGGRLAAGLGVGCAMLTLLVGLQLAAGVRGWNDARTVADIMRCLWRAVVTAAWVSVAEEVVFRGLLFGGLRRSVRWPGALALSSAFYSLVHFFARPPAPAAVEWTSGLAILGSMLQGWVAASDLLPGAFNLFLTGVVLGLAYQRTGSLSFPIGLHAAWVFSLKVYAYLTQPAGTARSGLWGTGRMLDGWEMTFVLGALLLVFVQHRWNRIASTDGVSWKPDAEAG